MGKHGKILGGLALVALVAGLASGGGALQPVKVQVAAAKPGADGMQTINVTIDVEKGWHIYANPVELEDFQPAQTIVKVSAKGKAQAAKVQYPAGMPHEEKGIGTFKIYEGHVTIPIVVQRGAGDSGPLEVSVRYQACDAKRCLPPATAKLAVP